MRLLAVHADRLAFEATLAADEPEPDPAGAAMEGTATECVVGFVGVEAGDSAAAAGIVAEAAAELRDAAERLSADRIVLYPRPELVDDPAEHGDANALLADLDAELAADYEVLRAPAGWHRSFELDAEGHPHARRSRRITPRRARGERSTVERYVLSPEGERLDPEDAVEADAVTDALAALLEASLEQGAHGASPTAVLDEHGLVTLGADVASEPTGAASNRWTPRGIAVRDLLLEAVRSRWLAFGAAPVEPAGGGSTERSGPGPRPCTDHVAALNALALDRGDLPVRLAGTATTAWGCSEAPGGILNGDDPDRPRTVPAMHTVAADVRAAIEAIEAQTASSLELADELGLDPAAVVYVTDAFREEFPDHLDAIVGAVDEAVLVEEIAEGGAGRAAATLELVATGDAGPLAVGRIVLDLESADRIVIADEGDDGGRDDDSERGDGDEHYDGDERGDLTLVHWVLCGPIESALAAALDAASAREPPRLPTWLAPTQVRFVPIDDEHVGRCDELAAAARAAGIRTDVDDRDERVGARIDAADGDWVPYYAVVGDRELDREALAVTVRATGREIELTVDELIERVREDVDDAPRPPQRLPPRVGDRRDAATSRR